MSEVGPSGFEIPVGYADRMSDATNHQLRDEIKSVIDVYGSEQDSQLDRFTKEYQERLLKTLAKLGLTEEIPLVRHAKFDISNPRLLPFYLRHQDAKNTLNLTEALTPHFYYQYKIYYGLKEESYHRRLGDSIEVTFPWEAAKNYQVHVLSRDPATNYISITPLTEAQGRDMLLDIADALDEHR